MVMLSERELNILCAVVSTYVRDGVPVSSRRIKERHGMSESSATIRGVLARLESMGFLIKPHTSAGRVPTDEGYRVYVDQLDTNFAAGEAFSSAFRDEIREQEIGVAAVMAAASRILGALSRNFAMVYGTIVQESRVQSLQLVDLGGGRLLVVVTLEPAYERTSVMRVDKVVHPEVLARVQRWIGQEVCGRTLEQAKEALDSAVRDNMTDEGVIAREVAARREEIFSGPPAVELYFEDRAHLLGQPDLADPRLLRVMLRILQDKSYLTSLLSGRIGEETCITIGQEHQSVELHPFSLVTAGYRMGAARGVLGVIGPTRMHYDLVSGLVRSAARELRAIGEEYF
jgi:heat-inducible transcriptional repressor